ncbi:MAG: mechanosensitive ion channel [Gammaproteobacteria bacterium]
MKYRGIRILVIIILLLCCGINFAISNSNDFFNVKQATQTLNKLNLQFSTQKDVTVKDYKKAIGILTGLQEQASICVDTAQDRIETINQFWKEAKVDEKEGAALTEAQKYLKDKKSQLIEQRSVCRIFILRSNEVIDSFSQSAQRLTTKKLLEGQPGFLRQMIASIGQIKKVVAHFDKKLFLTRSGLLALNTFNLTILVIFLCLSILFGVVIKYFASKAIQNVKMPENFSEKLRLILLFVSKKYTIFFLIFLTLAIFATIIDNLPQQITYLSWISYGLVAYVVGLAVIHFLFYPFRMRNNITGIAADIARPLITRLKLLLILLLLSFVIYVLWQGQYCPASVIALARTLFITLLAINLISIFWLINRIPALLIEHRGLQISINVILMCSLIAVLIAEWLGYQVLVTFVLSGIVLTLVSGFIAWVLGKIVTAMMQTLFKDGDGWQKSFRQFFGVKKHKVISELVFLGVILYILIWGGFLIVLLRIWVLSETNFKILMDALINGFKVASIEIVPSRILSAFIFCVIVFLIIRFIRVILGKRAYKSIEQSSQAALSAIITYIGVSITILVALIIAGVNFAGLAIIAGALSVGIGFGLQNVVANFVAGIVLLIERPIKPGDRIIIGDVEGFVEKIRIISTQIKTLQYSDLIVPNSEIVAKQVNNLMFRDFYYRVYVTVGVAYGSNVELVQKLLLQAAEEHPEVIKGEGVYQPTVLFREFGNSSLVFKLVCIIRNVNLHYVVQSELNTKVNKLFAENNVTIAFPQQDLHIKDWPAEARFPR